MRFSINCGIFEKYVFQREKIVFYFKNFFKDELREKYMKNNNNNDYDLISSEKCLIVR